jgi:hypothetical protein
MGMDERILGPSISMERIMWKTVFPVLFCLTNSVQAGILFELGNHPQPVEENILLNSAGSGATIIGHTDNSGVAVQFASTTDVLVAPSSGQAKVGAEDGKVNNVTVSVPGYNFQDFIGNLFKGSGTANINVVADEPGGGTLNFPFSLTLGNGEHFFTIIAQDGESIASITIDATGGFQDLRQPRISGLAPDINPHVAPVPEPATFTIMFGLAAVVLGNRSRRLNSLLRRRPL